MLLINRWPAWPTVAAFVLAAACLLRPGNADGAALYKWKDNTGKLHITDEAPPEGATVLEIIEGEPRAVNPRTETDSSTPPSDASAERNAELRRLCQLLLDARRSAGRARRLASSEKERAEDVDRQLTQLRERVGFDDDELDDFKDDIEALEEKSRLAEATAQRADLMAGQAELLVRLIEHSAAGKCPED